MILRLSATLLFCLTLTTPGWAELETYGCASIPGGKSCVFSHEQVKIMRQDDYCLAQMEKAMRANDGHLAVAYLDGTGRIPSPGYTDTGKAAFERDYQQWDAAKKACWKDKP